MSNSFLKQMFSISILVQLNHNKYLEYRIALKKYQKSSHSKHAKDRDLVFVIKIFPFGFHLC